MTEEQQAQQRKEWLEKVEGLVQEARDRNARYVTAGFWLGASMVGLVTLFWQDLWGMEGYIEHVRGHWFDAPAWIWIPPMISVLATYLWVRGEAKKSMVLDVPMPPTPKPEEPDKEP